MTFDFLAVNEKFLEHSLEGIGEPVLLISPQGKKYEFKGQVIRKYDTSGEDSRGIAQGKSQVMRVSSAVVTLRISSLLAKIPSGEIKGWMCQIQRYVHDLDTLDTMYIEAAPDGEDAQGLRRFGLVKTKQASL